MVRGFGEIATNMLGRLRQPIRLLLAHWYENRGVMANGASSALTLPRSVAALLALAFIIKSGVLGQRPRPQDDRSDFGRCGVMGDDRAHPFSAAAAVWNKVARILGRK